jgi:spore coat protein A
VNGAPWPRLEVSNVKYRLRILNASNARRYDLALDSLPFAQIGSDGGLLSAPLAQRSIRIAPSERFDVIVDFSKCRIGSKVTLLNREADGPAAQVMRFDVVRSEREESNVPAKLSEMSLERPEYAAMTRIFDFSYQRATHSWRINGQPFDPARMDARPKLNALEIWRLQTDFSHPLHLHLVHFQILSHSGRPGPYDSGWKDTIDLGAGQTANILVRFTGYRGRYVFHCHNLEHEDMSMMGNFEVV